jgi:hypothetical protein
MIRPAASALNEPMPGKRLSLKNGVINVRAKYP